MRQTQSPCSLWFKLKEKDIKIVTTNIPIHTFNGNCMITDSEVTQWGPTLCDPMDHTVHGILQARILDWVALPFSQLSHRGSPRMLEWVAYCFSRGIFLTQELNQGLLLCRQILYQLSHQGSPTLKDTVSTNSYCVCTLPNVLPIFFCHWHSLAYNARYLSGRKILRCVTKCRAQSHRH